MRGAVPKGVVGPARRDQRDGVAALTRSELASRVPMAMPSWRSKPSRLPKRMLPPTSVSDFRSSSRMPRTRPATRQVRHRGHRLPLDQRQHLLDARDRRRAAGRLVVVVEVVAADLVDDDVAVEAQDLAEQLLAEAVHDRHHGDQREHAEQDAQEREAGEDGDEALAAARPQIAQRQHPFEGRKRLGVGRQRGHWARYPLPLAPARAGAPLTPGRGARS